MDHLKEAIKKHITKAKQAAPHHGESDPSMDGEVQNQDDFNLDHAPEIQGAQSPTMPVGPDIAPNAHASGQDQKSMEHMKHLEALLGHGGPLSRKAYASGNDKDKEKMASIQKHKSKV